MQFGRWQGEPESRGPGSEIPPLPAGETGVRSPLPVWGEPGHQERRALVVQTHSGKVATKSEGQLVLRCLVWCLAGELQSGFSARLPC